MKKSALTKKRNSTVRIRRVGSSNLPTPFQCDLALRAIQMATSDGASLLTVSTKRLLEPSLKILERALTLPGVGGPGT